MAIIIKKKAGSSNKTQTLPKYKPFIDKLSVVITFQEADAHSIFSNIWLQIEDKAVFNDAGYKAKGKYKLAKFLNLGPASRPLFQFDYEDKKALKCRIDFNPRKIGLAGFSELQAILTSLMPDGWDYLLKHGNITRIDVAVDIPNSRPGMFAILPKQGLGTKAWTQGGKLETFVLGKKNANQTLIYNKKAHRLAQGKKWDGPATVRVERRLKHPAVKKIAMLSDLPNPFAALVLTDLEKMPVSEKKPWIWSLFKDSVAARGLPAALAKLPKEKRTMYRKHLEQHPHDQWSPSQIWEGWQDALKAVGLYVPKE